MPSHDDRLGAFYEVVLLAGRLRCADELIRFVSQRQDAIEGGLAATVEELGKGDIKQVDEIFTRFDRAKALVAKNLIHRRDAQRAGLEQPDLLLSVPNPGTVSSYLKIKGHDTAIVSFHVLGRDRVAVFLARGGGGKDKGLLAIPGFGDVFYDFVYLNGVRPEFLEVVDQYAASISHGVPDFRLIRNIFDFLASIVFMLLFKRVHLRKLSSFPTNCTLFSLYMPCRFRGTEDGFTSMMWSRRLAMPPACRNSSTRERRLGILI